MTQASPVAVDRLIVGLASGQRIVLQVGRHACCAGLLDLYLTMVQWTICEHCQ